MCCAWCSRRWHQNESAAARDTCVAGCGGERHASWHGQSGGAGADELGTKSVLGSRVRDFDVIGVSEKKWVVDDEVEQLVHAHAADVANDFALILHSRTRLPLDAADLNHRATAHFGMAVALVLPPA